MFLIRAFGLVLTFVVAVFSQIDNGEDKYNLNATSITRDEIINRAQNWVDRKIPYSQSATTDGYRQDCSGYVSMAWKSSKDGGGHTTYDMQDICTKISKSDMKRGDAILYPPDHVLLFHRWIDDEHDQFMEYAEHTYGQVASHDQRSFKSLHDQGFFPCRYHHVQD
eukprot:gene27019-32643_t